MEIDVLLIFWVFSKCPLTTDALLQNSSLAGTPLSEAEYESFFRSLAAHHAFHVICLRRTKLGCSDPTIQALDQYENHDVIPDGQICSNLPNKTSFPDFCSFALYRCSMKRHFAKRVLCPGETTEKPTVTQTNQEGIHIDHIVISAAKSSLELPDSTPTTSTESSHKPLDGAGTVAIELSTMPLLNTATKMPLLKLLSSSVVEMASKLISEIIAAFQATTEPSSKFMELTPTSITIATPEDFSKLTTPAAEEFSVDLTRNAAVMEYELSLATNATTVKPTWATITAPTKSFSELTTAKPEASTNLTNPMAEEFSVELTSTPAVITEPLQNKATEATIAAPARPTITAPTKSFPELATEASSKLTTPLVKEFSIEFTRTAAVISEPEVNMATEATTAEPTQPTITAPTKSSPELATATPEASSNLNNATVEEFSSELTSTPAVITEPELNKATTTTITKPTDATNTKPTKSSLELARSTELLLDSTSVTITDTTTTTSNTEPCIVDYPEPLDISPDFTSSTAATSSASDLPLHTATTSTKSVAATTSTTTASPQHFVHSFAASLPGSPPQPNSTMRILVLSFIGNKYIKSGDVAGISPLSQAVLGSGNVLPRGEIQNSLPTFGLKDFFLRLHDRNVQQLLDKVHNGISRGEQKRYLRSNSLQLLMALNPKSDSKKGFQR